METKKRKVGEARESCANLLDFHDVVDDWGEKNPCTDSSYLHVSPTNAISTASSVSTAAPPLACTAPLTSPVASTSREKFCFVSLSSLRTNFPSVLLFTVWITYMASIPHKPVCNCKRELYPYSVRPLSIEAVGVRRSTEFLFTQDCSSYVTLQFFKTRKDRNRRKFQFNVFSFHFFSTSLVL